MTKKIAISVPDDVADRLAHEANVSAYIAESVRWRIDREYSMQLLAAAGYQPTPEELAEADARIAEAQRLMTPELGAQADALLMSARRRAGNAS
jgi:hypothetical protein